MNVGFTQILLLYNEAVYEVADFGVQYDYNGQLHCWLYCPVSICPPNPLVFLPSPCCNIYRFWATVKLS